MILYEDAMKWIRFPHYTLRIIGPVWGEPPVMNYTQKGRAVHMEILCSLCS